MSALIRGCVIGVVLVFGGLLADIVSGGLEAVDWAFLSQAPSNAGREGGIAPILHSTLLILGVAIAVTVPLGLGTAIFLTEFTRPTQSRAIRMSLDILAGVPSIVFGLFGNALFCVALGLGFSILSGGLTLACMMLPIFIRSAEAGLRGVPHHWRSASAAVGISHVAALRYVLLPAAGPAIVGGLMLSMGRAMAETAALIFTSGYVDRSPDSLFSSGRALSVHIYDLSMNVTGGDANAYATALVLIVLLALINGVAASLSHRLLTGRIVSA